MCGSVFKEVFRVLSREFESIETSPGSSQLLGENLDSLCKIADKFHDDSKKKLSNDISIEVNIVIS